MVWFSSVYLSVHLSGLNLVSTIEPKLLIKIRWSFVWIPPGNVSGTDKIHVSESRVIFIMDKDIKINEIHLGKLYEPIEFQMIILDIQVTEVERSSVVKNMTWETLMTLFNFGIQSHWGQIDHMCRIWILCDFHNPPRLNLVSYVSLLSLSRPYTAYPSHWGIKVICCFPDLVYTIEPELIITGWWNFHQRSPAGTLQWRFHHGIGYILKGNFFSDV